MAVDGLVDFCLTEIALEGFEGCRLTDLFGLLDQSAQTLSIGRDDDNYDSSFVRVGEFFADLKEHPETKASCENYLWKLLVNQIELEFYLLTPSAADKQSAAKTSKTSKTQLQPPAASNSPFIVNECSTETGTSRGVCRNYANRTSITEKVRSSAKSFQDYVAELGARLVIVASQCQRNRALCPSFKHLGLETLTDIEYCVLEAIGKQRFDGVYTTGDDGLTTLFNLAPKQLHYVLVMLESHRLIKKQAISSQKKRLIVHLVAYSQKTKSLLECVCEHLMQKHLRQGDGCFDTLVNIKRRFFLASKRFKNLMQNAEKQSILKRYTELREHRSKSKGGSGLKRAGGPVRMRQVRMIKLTDSYFKTMLANYSTSTLSSLHSLSAPDNESESSCLVNEDGEENGDLDSQNGDGVGSSSSSQLMDLVGSHQSIHQSLYAQMFAEIERAGKEGIALKRLGAIFGFDFYKSRRIAAHLQTHPEVVTIIKETDRGKAKYQTVALRKFLSTAKAAPAASQQADQPASTSNGGGQHPDQSNLEPDSSPLQADLTVVKYLGSNNNPSQSIQAVMSNRMLARTQLILDYIAKHRICTKYEVTKEIRSIEAAQGLRGVIDSKTTKRMLFDLEKEGKLVVFNVTLKNICYMGVRACGISDTDEEFVKYCSTFKRTFDSVDLKVAAKNAADGNDDEAGHDAAASLNSSNASPSKPSKASGEPDDGDDDNGDGGDDSQHQYQFKLTKSFIQSTVESLKFSNNFSKIYALVPKYQKTTILHRLLQYLLFFYDGKPLHTSPQAAEYSRLIDRVNQPLSAMTTNPLYSVERKIVDSCLLPTLSETYQPLLSTHADWRTYIPPLERINSNPEVENSCIFIGEIFSHMPLSVFSAIIVINHQVPGLVALLKHPFKRHILVKDLPPNLIAPLIYERRYLQRMLCILQNMACLGLVTFVQSPCKTNQATNRDVQSQMIYVHRKAEFYDTTANKCNTWHELQAVSKHNFDQRLEPTPEVTKLSSSSSSTCRYDKYQFEFHSDLDVTDFWRKLLHVSMNTYGFNASRHLKEDKRLRKKLMAKVLEKARVEEISDLKSMLAYSDGMGPGGYHSQLFLNSIKNWILPSNLTHATKRDLARKRPHDGAQQDSSSLQSAPVAAAINKEDDLSMAPYSELALSLGFYRSIGKSTPVKRNRSPANSSSSAQKAKGAKKRKASESEGEETQAPQAKKQPAVKRPLAVSKAASLKIMKAKTLLDRAKMFKAAPVVVMPPPLLKPDSAASHAAERRAIWSREEDELILLIKVTSLYFFPSEKRITFKLISDIMNQIVPDKCVDKKISSFGRRIKALLKSNLNLLFVSNKLELCKQDKEIEKKYAKALAKLKRNLVDHEQVDTYKNFVLDLRDKFLKCTYSSEASGQAAAAVDAAEVELELPKTLDEFNRKYAIKNSLPGLFGLSNSSSQNSDYEQPKSDYEISFNTLHSAIHSSILINDKTPRLNESLNLFDKYSDQLLTDVVTKMSRSHRILAATKFSELKKKNITAFSKHIGKAFHISQRYQLKWTNSQVSCNLLADTAEFKNSFIDNELRHRQPPPGQASTQKRVKFAMPSSRAGTSAEMFDCSDKDDLGMASFLAHTLDNPSVQVLIDVPNKIFESKLF